MTFSWSLVRARKTTLSNAQLDAIDAIIASQTTKHLVVPSSAKAAEVEYIFRVEVSNWRNKSATGTFVVYKTLMALPTVEYVAVGEEMEKEKTKTKTKT